MNYKRSAENIAHHMHVKGYNVTYRLSTPLITFYVDGIFVFCIDLSLVGETQAEMMLTEVIEGR